jgi:hypothetical protein
MDFIKLLPKHTEIKLNLTKFKLTISNSNFNIYENILYFLNVNRKVMMGHVSRKPDAKNAKFDRSACPLRGSEVRNTHTHTQVMCLHVIIK